MSNVVNFAEYKAAKEEKEFVATPEVLQLLKAVEHAFSDCDEAEVVYEDDKGELSAFGEGEFVYKSKVVPGVFFLDENEAFVGLSYYADHVLDTESPFHSDDDFVQSSNQYDLFDSEHNECVDYHNFD